MSSRFNIDKAIRYSPYSKPDGEMPTISIISHGHISVSRLVVETWIKSHNRVDLLLIPGKDEKGNDIRAIGLKPVEKGGLSLVRNAKSKSRYIAGRGFLKQFRIPLTKRTLDCSFEGGIVIAPDINRISASNGASREDSVVSDVPTVTGRIDKIKDEIFRMCPLETSGQDMSIPDFVQHLLNNGYKPQRMTTRMKRNFENKVRIRVRALVDEGKFKVARKAPHSGFDKLFYARVA